MTLHLSEQAVPANKQVAKADPYYKLQIRAWTPIDPAHLTLRQLAELVDSGAAVLTATEVIKVADSITAIDDSEVRETFENLRAAERVVRNMKALPTAVRERLQSALSHDSRSSAAA
jgi:DNA repair exonuclease SbcCD nuclease subunit